jgi:auxin responsive GH3 family protein
MAQYIPTLEFYSGGLPLVSTMYGSSECYLGINFKPLSNPYDVSYTLLPNMAYFEFLPVDNNHKEVVPDVQCNGVSVTDRNGKEKVEAVDLVDVKLGHYYELIVTTFTGEFFLELTFFFPLQNLDTVTCLILLIYLLYH